MTEAKQNGHWLVEFYYFTLIIIFHLVGAFIGESELRLN